MILRISKNFFRSFTVIMVELEVPGIQPPPTAWDVFERIWLVGLKNQIQSSCSFCFELGKYLFLTLRTGRKIKLKTIEMRQIL